MTLSLSVPPGQAMPAVLVGDASFDFGVYGSVGGAFIRSPPGQTEAVTVTVTASHGTHTASVAITVTPQPSSTLYL